MTSKSSEVTTSYNPKLPTQSTGQRIKNKNVFIRIADFFYTDKETNRKYRRTVFDKSDWKQHRNSNRYFREVANMPNSLILRGLGIPTMIVTVFSWMIVLHNVLVERFGLKIWPNWPLLSFPPLPFTLLSSALGLLLVFRTNVAYARWKDGRISWSMVSARSFDLMRQSLMWMNDERSKSRLVRYTVAFAKTMKWHLGHQGNDRRLHGDLEGVLTNKEIEQLLASRGRVQWTMMKIADEIRESKLVPNLQSHIDKGVCEMTSAFFTCERIFTTPIPLMYTRHTARFLLMWLLTTPMSLYHEFRRTEKVAIPFVIPIISFFSAIFLFGIEELGVQIEEPFSILPLANICNNIQYTGEDLLHDANIAWIHADDKDDVGDSVHSTSANTDNVGGKPAVQIKSDATIAPIPTPVPITTSTSAASKNYLPKVEASTEIGLGLGVTVLESEMTAMDMLFARVYIYYTSLSCSYSCLYYSLSHGYSVSPLSYVRRANPISYFLLGLFVQSSLQARGTTSNVSNSDGGVTASTNSGGADSFNTSASGSGSAIASASASREMITLTTESSIENSHDPGDGDINDIIMDPPTNATTSNVPASTPTTTPTAASSSVIPQESVSAVSRAIVDDK